MYQCNTEAYLHAYFCWWKAISITYYECVSAALVIQHAMGMHCITLPYVWLYHIFPHYLINSTSFGTKLQVNQHTTCGLTSPTKFVQNISHSKNSARYYHKCTYTCKSSIHHSYQILMKPEFSQESFKKYSNIKFHENLLSRSRVAPCRQTDKMDRWTDKQTSRS